MLPGACRRCLGQDRGVSSNATLKYRRSDALIPQRESGHWNMSEDKRFTGEKLTELGEGRYRFDYCEGLCCTLGRLA
jgi:hypothetical protein